MRVQGYRFAFGLGKMLPFSPISTPALASAFTTVMPVLMTGHGPLTVLPAGVVKLSILTCSARTLSVKQAIS
jgi:hypothetical protein